MKSHIIKSEKELLLEEAIKKQLTNARTAGISIGAKSVSKVIYDKATAKDKTDIEFCEIGLAIKEDKIN